MVFAVILQVYSYCYNVVMYLFGVIIHESYNCTVTILQGYLHAPCTILYTIILPQFQVQWQSDKTTYKQLVIKCQNDTATFM